MKSIRRISNIHIFALASQGKGISGGDRIFIELSRRWSKDIPITIHTWKEGSQMCERQNLREKKNLKIKIYDLWILSNAPLFLNYLARILSGIILGFTFQPSLESSKINSKTYIYNASEFWMDSLPCIIIKIRFPQVKWVASWYQTAPNPLKGYAEIRRDNKYYFRSFAYWFTQMPIKPLVKKYADKVIVNNEYEKKQFPEHTKKGNSIVLIGAVPLSDIQKFLNTNYQLLKTKKYDAVFQGRFHPQKGVVELIDIWATVVKKIPNAKLALIGDGPLMNEVKSKISENGLVNNIKLFGYVFDGSKKYRIFANSKIVVHPAYYDSGGMATAEAMAFGIPAIGFDLKAYQSYYPDGMIFSSSKSEFAKNIVYLLKNTNKLNDLGKKAKKIIEEYYSWEARADEILKKIIT